MAVAPTRGKKPPSDPWQNRIIGEGEEAPDQLLANPLNFRTHPSNQAAALVGGLNTIGWITRVVVNQRTGHVIDGHLRVAQALKRGEATVPITYVNLTDDEERIALATLDPISAMAGQDDDILREVLRGLEVVDEDLAMHLASLDPGGELKGGAGGADPDSAPDLTPAKVRSRVGEIWQLGSHRLLIDDATSAANIAKLMDGAKADAVWTDPPYNVNYQGSDGKKIANDHLEDAPFREFLRQLFVAAIENTKAGGAIYIAHADSEGYNFRGAMRDAGWLCKQAIVWVKNSFTLGRQDYQWQHEPLLYGWKPGAGHCWYGDRNKTTVIDDRVNLDELPRVELLAMLKGIIADSHPSVLDVAKPSRNDIHPTMKPVALIHRTLGNSLMPDEAVLDVCGGSGSTLIAAEQMGARAYLAELDPVYGDAIIRRWQDFTGERAFRIGDDHDFDSLPTRDATAQTENQART